MNRSENNSQNLQLKDGDDSGSVPDGVRFQVFVDGLGICAAPGCHERGVHHRTKLAECAHIIPRKVGSHPREDYFTPLGERKKETNLLYLCERHHKIVDNVEHAEKFTADVLRQWKRTHEEWAKSVTKESPYLPNALKEALSEVGKSLAHHASEGKAALSQIIEICQNLILRNRIQESKILLAQISTLAIKTNDPDIIYTTEYLNARLLRTTQNIPESKKALLGLIQSYSTKSEAMAEYIDLCKAAPEPTDELASIEDLLKKLDPENSSIIVHNLIKNSENFPISLDDLSVDIIENRRLYEMVLAHNITTLDSNGKKDERDQLVQTWGEKFETSPRPLLFQATFTSVDTLRAGSSNPEEVCKSIEAVNNIENQLSKKDPLSPKDKLMWEFHKFRLIQHFCLISGETELIEVCWKSIIDIIKQCYFDTFVFAILSELLQQVPLSADEWKIIHSQSKYSSVIPSDEFVDMLFLKGIGHTELHEDVTNLLDNDSNASTQSLWKSLKILDIDQITFALKEKNSQSFYLSCLRYIGSKKPDSAIEICDRLLDDSEFRIDLLFIKLITLKELDRKDECLATIRSISIDEVVIHGIELIADITFGWSQWDLFIQSSHRLLSINPTPKLHAKLAMAYANLHDDTNAISHAEAALSGNCDLDTRYSQNTLRILIESLQLKGMGNEACLRFEKYAVNRKDFHILMLGADAYLKSNLVDRDERALGLILQGFRSLENVHDDVYLSVYLITLDLANSGKIDLNNKQIVCDGNFIKIDGLSKWFYVGNKEDSMGAITITNFSENYQAVIGKKVNSLIEWPAEKFTGNPAGREIVNILSPEAFLCVRSHEAMAAAAESGEKPIWSVKMLSEDGSLDTENLRKFSASIHKNTDDFFDAYVKDSLPFSFLCKMEGSPIQAIARISRTKRGFIKCNNGTSQQLKDQSNAAQRALDGVTCYLDGLAALVLTESGLLEKVCSFMPNVGACTSVIRLFRQEAKDHESTRSSVGRGTFVNHRFEFQPKNESSEKSLIKKLLDAADLLDSLPIKRIGKPTQKGESTHDWDEVLPNYIMDPLRYSQKEGAILMTEDATLSDALRISGESRLPESFSSLIMMRLLAESGKIEWEDYYKYFGRLSLIRFHLLSINADEMMRAVLHPVGGELVMMKPSNLELMNLGYTLSKENGVENPTLVAILGQFFSKVIKDGSISTEIADEIFSITIVRTLSGDERSALRKPTFDLCSHIVNSGIYTGSQSDAKLDILRLQIKRFSGDYDPLVEALPSLLRITKQNRVDL